MAATAAPRGTPASPDRSSAGYDEEGQPLAEYGGLLAAFATILSVGAVAAKRQRRLPDRVRAHDIVLGSVATHKLARLVAKDKVTSVVRAPFTRREEEAGPAEVEEQPRGHGLRYVVGELLLCPFCLAQWIAAAYVFGLVFTPRITRLVAAMMAVVGLSDFLQVAYKAAENRREG
jgi:hypothetical protein